MLDIDEESPDEEENRALALLRADRDEGRSIKLPTCMKVIIK